MAYRRVRGLLNTPVGLGEVGGDTNGILFLLRIDTTIQSSPAPKRARVEGSGLSSVVSVSVANMNGAHLSTPVPPVNRASTFCQVSPHGATVFSGIVWPVV